MEEEGKTGASSTDPPAREDILLSGQPDTTDITSAEASSELTDDHDSDDDDDGYENGEFFFALAHEERVLQVSGSAVNTIECVKSSRMKDAEKSSVAQAPSRTTNGATTDCITPFAETQPPKSSVPAAAITAKNQSEATPIESFPASEVQLLKNALAMAVQNLQNVNARCEAQKTVIRDLSLVVESLQHAQKPASSSRRPDSKPSKTRKSILPNLGRRKAASKDNAWRSGWLMNYIPALRDAEIAWSKCLVEDALAQITQITAETATGPDRHAKKLFVDASLLRAAILRSAGQTQAGLDACADILEFCYEHNMPIAARKARFNRGLAHLYSQRYVDALYCFNLAVGIEEAYAEQLAVNRQLALEKVRETAALEGKTSSPALESPSFWNIPLGFYEV